MEPSALGEEAYELIRRLYPLCRSITGDGVRASLSLLEELVPLEISEVPSGTSVLDWTVPPEWNIRDAYIADESGRRVIDFRQSNLHVVSYSTPVSQRMSFEELRPFLHALPDQPHAIPYRTSYYERTWGFCLSQVQLDAMGPGVYDVVIDSSLEPGSLTYAEAVVPGRTDGEILVSTHICHPSLCDDNLSGIAVSALLARELLAGSPPRHTIRFLFAPGTIGAIAWLARNGESIQRIRHGLTLTCLGDDHAITYKRTFDGDRPIDRAAAHVLETSRLAHDVIDFFPYGYDERQFNAPGFRLPVGSLMRGRHGRFPEYHTSGDDLNFVSSANLGVSLHVVGRILGVVDADRRMRNTAPFGEPQLGRRGLYRALGGTDISNAQLTMLWILTMSDGEWSLLDIAERAGARFEDVASTALILEEYGLLEEV